jgi:hypothetical protein
MKTFTKILTLILVIFSLNITAQNDVSDPGWQWARFSNTYHSASYSSSNGGLKTDFDNNLFTFFYYEDSIMIEDTAFYHPTEHPYDCNIAIIKRNSIGGFLKALDIYTTTGNYFYYAEIELDKGSNVYLYVVCSDTVFVNGQILIPIIPGHSVFLLKFDNNLEFQWANTISSICQDISGGIAVSDDNYIYLSAEHLCNDHYIANYFDQDSADIYGGLNSLLKIDPDGQIIWRCEIRNDTNMTADVTNTVVGRDGNIYVLGYARGDIYIQGDTVKYPASSGFSAATFIVQFDQNGSHHNAFFNTNNDHYDFYIFDSWFNVDQYGNYYFSGWIQETSIFGSDTIEVPDGHTYGFMAKTDPSFNPIWYQGIMNIDASKIEFQLGLIDDSIAFAFNAVGSFTFLGNDYGYSNTIGEVILGLFSPAGDLVNYQVTDANQGTTLRYFQVDNCGNFLIDGEVGGWAYFGNDTLDAVFKRLNYLAKNFRIHPVPIDMPEDTANCGPLVLYAPEEHLYYKWNDELSDQNWYLVNTTGTVNLKVADESCCWSEAETHVTIYPPVQFSLGADATIRLTDTLELSVADIYDSYLWSTGDTGYSITIPAAQMQIGDNKIWLYISNDLCFASDTINIKVIDNSNVQEIYGPGILLYPNPAYTSLQIINDGIIIPDFITFYDQTGIKVLNVKPLNNLIDISGLKSGVYIVEFVLKNNVIRRKLVVL